MSALPQFEESDIICKMITDSFEVNIFKSDEQGKLLSSTVKDLPAHPLKKNWQELLHPYLSQIAPSPYPQWVSTPYLENFLIIPIVQFEWNFGHLIIGPVLEAVLTDQVVDGLMYDHRIPQERRKELLEYYRNIPIYSGTKLLQIGILLYYSIYRKQLDMKELIEHMEKDNSHAIKVKDRLNNHLNKSYQNPPQQHNYLLEQQVLQCIREGRKDELMQFAELHRQHEGIGILSQKSHLRHLKNVGICSITLYTRASIEGGLHQEVAFPLSDLYIQELEELHTAEEIYTLLDHALSDFTGKVQEIKELQYSKPVTICRRYIFNHIYQPITLEQLGEASGLHPGYLSRLFKREVGIGINQYIRQERIEEAKKLLKLSDYPLSKICLMLNFNDQSYFTKTFKAMTGVTPGQYRNAAHNEPATS
ncbi:helix-turn-helix domain-containing protein [Paenibacillus sp. CAA11]|uniref:helix-turn-helix domain-containing protein n=1 Tax=Paenibacillus sp. CAA11 TaxID=1532905 RepID=UPI00131EEFD1|nr:helix-turn-helix domain-containing protein [Paenibacillus sp. CAA11]